MKVPDSGMPDETYWESLFDIRLILDRLGPGPHDRDVAELGCGYGTFTLPVARRIAGRVHAFDLEPEMCTRTQQRADEAGIGNIHVNLRDVISDGFGLDDGSCDACLLFNILHCPESPDLLIKAARIVRPSGRVLVIHWRSDVKTPRGPAREVRPRYGQISTWAESAGLTASPEVLLPPWHFGVILTKQEKISSHGRRQSA